MLLLTDCAGAPEPDPSDGAEGCSPLPLPDFLWFDDSAVDVVAVSYPSACRVDIDENGDAQTDLLRSFTVSEDGLEVVEVLERLSSIGPPEEEIRSTFDTAGRLLIEQTQDADGAFYRVYQYDGDGPLQKIEAYAGDQRAGAPVSRWLILYDEKGQLVREELDGDADGVVDGPQDRIITYSYDSLGRVIQLERDDGADASPEERLEYAYDECGRLLSVEQHLLGSDSSGSKGAAMRVSLGYDEDSGRLLTESDEKLSADSRGKRSGTIQYTYDGQGRLLQRVGAGIRVIYQPGCNVGLTL